MADRSGRKAIALGRARRRRDFRRAQVMRRLAALLLNAALRAGRSYLRKKALTKHWKEVLTMHSKKVLTEVHEEVLTVES